jgi:hypothetical protein
MEIHIYSAAIAFYCHRNLARREEGYTKYSVRIIGYVTAVTGYCCKILDGDHMRAKPK